MEDEYIPKMKVETVYAVYTVVGSRGSIGELVGVFSDTVKADRNAQGIGWHGSKGAVRERKGIIVDYGEIHLLDNDHPERIRLDVNQLERKENLRDRALSKLTYEEQCALGLQ